MNQLELIQSKIYEIKGQRVMLDFDLAELYQVETRVLNQAVKCNIDRFPEIGMGQRASKRPNDEIMLSFRIPLPVPFPARQRNL